jgi:U-box domain
MTVKMSDEEKQDNDRTDAEDEIVVPPEMDRVDHVKGGVVQDVEEAHFPSVCYCPITKRIMVDPVVGPSGTSFEKDAVMAREGELITYYPNRALRAYIETLQLINDDEGSVRGTLRKLDTNLRTNWDRFVDKAAFPVGQSKPLPDGKMIKA